MTDNVDALAQIMALCNCEVSISINSHRNNYQSVDEYLRELEWVDMEMPQVAEMIRLDTVVHVQCYPTTPVGFYSTFHWDLRLALLEMLEILRREQ